MIKYNKTIVSTCILMLYSLLVFGQLKIDYITLKNDIKLINLNGESVSIFKQLDSGKTVILEISATWCPPCWRYHNTHILDNLHKRKDFFVMFIEGDIHTPDSLLLGKGRSMGNWTKINYPIFNIKNESDLGSEILFHSFPTLYMILPDRRMYNISPHKLDVSNVINIVDLKNHFTICTSTTHNFNK